MFCYSDNVDKELKYNQYNLQSTAIPPIQKNSVVPKKQASKVEKYFGDNLDGAIAEGLLCKNNSTKGDALKLSLEWWKHHKSLFPLLAKLVFSVDSNLVTPKRAKLNPEKMEDLVVVKCNLRLLDHGLQKVNCNLFD